MFTCRVCAKSKPRGPTPFYAAQVTLPRVVQRCRNGRIVIQCTRLTVERIGERAFELTEQQLIEQTKQNHAEMSFFMCQLGDALQHHEDEFK